VAGIGASAVPRSIVADPRRDHRLHVTVWRSLSTGSIFPCKYLYLKKVGGSFEKFASRDFLLGLAVGSEPLATTKAPWNDQARQIRDAPLRRRRKKHKRIRSMSLAFLRCREGTDADVTAGVRRRPDSTLCGEAAAAAAAARRRHVDPQKGDKEGWHPLHRELERDTCCPDLVRCLLRRYPESFRQGTNERLAPVPAPRRGTWRAPSSNQGRPVGCQGCGTSSKGGPRRHDEG
jgi:hypothetical protein